MEQMSSPLPQQIETCDGLFKLVHVLSKKTNPGYITDEDYLKQVRHTFRDYDPMLLEQVADEIDRKFTFQIAVKDIIERIEKYKEWMLKAMEWNRRTQPIGKSKLVQNKPTRIRRLSD